MGTSGPVVWAARAGEHGPPLNTEGAVALFNQCEKSVSLRFFL